MLHYINTDIVFQEFPDEVTLAINVSGCPCHCPGCHSQFLWADRGHDLTTEALSALILQAKDTITCVGFMGGRWRPSWGRQARWTRATEPRRTESWLVHWAHSNLPTHRPTAFRLYQSGSLSPPSWWPQLPTHQSTDVPPMSRWILRGYHLPLLETSGRNELISFSAPD